MAAKLGQRAKPQPGTTQAMGQTALDAEMNRAAAAGGGIQAGAHPEFDTNQTLADKAIAAFSGFGKAWDEAWKKYLGQGKRGN